MIYEIIYPITVYLLIVSGIILSMGSWLWYKHLWYGFLAWMDTTNDKLFYWVLDRVLGEHELIRMDDETD